MNRKGQFGGLTSAISSLFSLGVVSSVAARVFGTAKNVFMGAGRVGKNIFFR